MGSQGGRSCKSVAGTEPIAIVVGPIGDAFGVLVPLAVTVVVDAITGRVACYVAVDTTVHIIAVEVIWVAVGAVNVATRRRCVAGGDSALVEALATARRCYPQNTR